MHVREREALYDAIKRYVNGEKFPHDHLRILVEKLFESEQEARRELAELEEEYGELFNQKSGIPWQKYDPENPPEEGDYFVSNGIKWEYGYFTTQWEMVPFSRFDEEEITHYCPINLPGEE